MNWVQYLQCTWVTGKGGATNTALLTKKNIFFILQSLTHRIPCDEAWQRVSWYQLSSNRHPARAPELTNTIAWHTHKNCYPREWLRVLASSIASTREYWRDRLRVLASTIASTRVYDCEYSRVRLRVLASILEFSAREFRLACGQGIARVRSLTLAFGTRVWYCEWYESLAHVC